MCDVLQLQRAGAFLRHARNLQPVKHRLAPNAVVGSWPAAMDVARGRCPACDQEDTRTRHATICPMGPSESDEPVDFLTSIRRGLDELVADTSDEEEESDDEGEYYQASKDNTYYSPEHKHSCGFPLDDALDLSATSTASSSLVTSWAHQDLDDDDDDDEEDEEEEDDADDSDDGGIDDLIFPLEL